MSRHEIATLGVRIAAIIALFMGSQSLGSSLLFSALTLRRFRPTLSTYSPIPAAYSVTNLLAFFGTFCVLSVLSIMLWFAADGVATLIVGRRERADAPLVVGLDAQTAFATLLSALGAYSVINGLFSLLRACMMWRAAVGSDYGLILLCALPLGVALQFGLGALFLKRAPHIARACTPKAREASPLPST